MGAFDCAYWPLLVAVAWVATRDRDFVDQIPFDKPLRSLAPALATYVVEKGFRSHLKWSHVAFLALRDATAEGSVQAVGEPYRWLTGRPPRKVCEPTRVIEPLEIVSAVCRDDGTPDCLVPKDLHAHGSRFQNVLFRRGDVLARFPPLPATLSAARNEDKAVEALSTYLTDRTTRNDANRWLRERGFNFGPRTFQQRVWPEARKLAGLAPVAPRGRKRQS